MRGWSLQGGGRKPSFYNVKLVLFLCPWVHLYCIHVLTAIQYLTLWTFVQFDFDCTNMYHHVDRTISLWCFGCDVQNLSPTSIGLVFLIAPLVVVLVAPLCGRVADQYPVLKLLLLIRTFLKNKTVHSLVMCILNSAAASVANLRCAVDCHVFCTRLYTVSCDVMLLSHSPPCGPLSLVAHSSALSGSRVSVRRRSTSSYRSE